MPYELAEVNADLSDSNTWERLGKFLVAHVIAGVVMALVIIIVGIPILQESKELGMVFLVGVLLVGNAWMLSYYENWRGCHFKKD
jgi:hypothetical protein